jgi:hypothetical protein
MQSKFPTAEKFPVRVIRPVANLVKTADHAPAKPSKETPMNDAERIAAPDIGWKHLSNSRKWHYFSGDGRSLCGGWLTLGASGEFGNDESPENCGKCRRRLAVRTILEQANAK